MRSSRTCPKLFHSVQPVRYPVLMSCSMHNVLTQGVTAEPYSMETLKDLSLPVLLAHDFSNIEIYHDVGYSPDCAPLDQILEDYDLCPFAVELHDDGAI